MEPRSIELCPECGYSFNGLPAEGHCPECGFEYRLDQIIVYGWQSNGEQTSHWYALAAGIVFTPLMIILGWIVIALWLFFIAVAAVIHLVHAWFQQQEESETRRGPVQLRLLHEGYASRPGFGPVTLRPWKHVVSMTITPIQRDRFRIMIRNWPSAGGQRTLVEVELRDEQLRDVERLAKWKVGRGFRFDQLQITSDKDGA